MNTARIVVLTIALGAGGVAADLASGSDNKSVPVQPTAQIRTVDVLVAKADIGLGQSVSPEILLWQTLPAATASNARARQTGTLALRRIADLNAAETMSDDTPRRSDSINVVRYGVASPTTITK